MRILYDGFIYGAQATGGVNRYFTRLIAGLPVSFRPALLLGRRRAINYPTHPKLKVYEYGRRRLDAVSHRLSLGLSRLEDYRVRQRVDSGRFDLAHPTYYNLLTGREVGDYRCPVVLTVWDMIHERFPETLDVTGAHVEEKRRALHGADRLICISENTRDDLLERYPALADRVHVTHLASSIDESMSRGPEPVPRRPFFLYVGFRAAYKNFGLLLSAFARIAPTRPDAALCVVGAPLTEEEQRRVSELGLGGRLELFEHPTDAHLAKLYRSSVALVYPSLYEGFGIPPLEAMSCGTPVVASDRSSLPEVVGDAGLLFDPRSADQLSDILRALLDQPSERERLIERGYRRARLFSWEKTVAQTLDIYRAVTSAKHSRAAEKHA
ncbi:MAG: glycosyltransferase family 4 protein [Pyrinomonadaceae bacterium]